MGKLRAAPRPRPAGRRTRNPGALARRARWVPCSPGGSEGSAGPPLSDRHRGPPAPPRRCPGATGAAAALAWGRPLPSPSPGGGAPGAVTSRGARWQHLPAR